ncbi:restriction endonuclease [Rhodobacter sp. Har01]|uniref:restriction endonuclease n=1 Tax=Rhodobacter sp. Har01 TaxID=2883999 RepID=UPI001D075BB6|nr:restriction endonuclease [Rhodobacter sp. Har01]MCB6178133.1 restriction endonuclease [Rhodobacter sp. Har01]
MTIPSMGEFLLPCLRLLAGEARNARACLPSLQREFGLTGEEMAEMLKSGTRTRVFDRADWAIFHLLKAGLVDRPARGVMVASDEGRAWLAARKPLDWRIIRSLPSHQAAMAKAAQKSGESEPSPRPAPADLPGETPEDVIDRAHREIESALADGILQRLYAINPVRFERLILELLAKMGYGAGNFGSHHMTRASGDGGIDGIIHEDALGLDAVYIQAKRYAPEIKVGRPAIQQFIGSLTGEGATKGVFVTTSTFSADARAYLGKVQHRVVLIDGAHLARLMIRHGVGVRDRLTYVIRSVDEDYFADPEG